MRALFPLCEEQAITHWHPKPSRDRAERECHRVRHGMLLRHLAVTVVTTHGSRSVIPSNADLSSDIADRKARTD